MAATKLRTTRASPAPQDAAQQHQARTMSGAGARAARLPPLEQEHPERDTATRVYSLKS